VTYADVRGIILQELQAECRPAEQVARKAMKGLKRPVPPTKKDPNQAIRVFFFALLFCGRLFPHIFQNISRLAIQNIADGFQR